MNIRVLTAASLLALSVTAHAGNCVVVVVGGAQTKPAAGSKEPRDIASDVLEHTLKTTGKADCQVVSGTNQTPEEFELMLQRAAKLRRDAKTQFHFTFTDHGTQNFVYLKEGVFLPYAKVNEILKRNFPAKTPMSYSSSNCYGDLSNFVLDQNLDSHFNICGGESTFPGRLSLNLRIYRNDLRGERGAYTAAMVNALAKGEPLDRAHLAASRADSGNLARVPGLLTSQALVYKELQRSGHFTKEDLPGGAPDLLNFWVRHAKRNRAPLINALDNVFQREHQQGGCGEVCYFSRVLNLQGLDSVQRTPIELELAGYQRRLPPRAMLQLRASVEYLIKHRSLYAAKLNGNLERIGKAADNAATFDAMENPEFYFHLNQVLLAPALKAFFEVASPEARRRYTRLTACESSTRFE